MTDIKCEHQFFKRRKSVVKRCFDIQCNPAIIEGAVETTGYESANQKMHGLKATKARQVEELSGIQTTELSVETPAPLWKVSP